MYLTTKCGVRIDVEAFVNCGYGYDIKCEVCCEDGTLIFGAGKCDGQYGLHPV